MTIGSPFASAVSGPGTDDTNAIRFPSGDHATLVPMPGSGAFVPVIAARNLAPVPSGFAIASPLVPSTRPRYAIHWPSGDHCGSPDDSLSPPKRTVFPSASVITEIWPYGRPDPSLLSTTYATRVPSGDSWTAVTARSLNRSLLCKRFFDDAACGMPSASATVSIRHCGRMMGPFAMLAGPTPLARARRRRFASLPSSGPPQRGSRVGDPGASRWPQALPCGGILSREEGGWNATPPAAVVAQPFTARCRIKLSTTEDTEDAEEKSRFEQA